MKTNASITGYREQVKEDATNAEASNGRHVTDCETGPRRDDFEKERDRYSCDVCQPPSLRSGPLATEARTVSPGFDGARTESDLRPPGS